MSVYGATGYTLGRDKINRQMAANELSALRSTSFSGGGINDKMMSQVMDQMIRGQNQANEANEKRYQEALGELNQGYSQAIDSAQSFGSSLVDDANMSAEQLHGQFRQNIISRGVANTTMMANSGRMAEQERARNLARIRDAQAQNLSGIEERHGQAMAGLMSQKQDQFANPMEIMQMMMEATKGQAQSQAAAAAQQILSKHPAGQGFQQDPVYVELRRIASGG